MGKHTKGPWKREGNVVRNANGLGVAVVPIDTPKPEAEANARLIAQAPALLEMLDCLVWWLERHQQAGGETPSEETMDAARAAIHKATVLQ